MKQVSVIGHFAHGLEYLDGQTIKTKIIANELCNVYGNEDVFRFDTHGGVKILLKAPIYVWKALKETRNVIIMPAHNGLRVFGRLLPLFKVLFYNRKIHYVVIGGWLPKMVERKKRIAKDLKKFDGIYVETNTMKKALEMQGFENVYVMPNCKNLNAIPEENLVYPKGEPYKFCIFSRIMKEKGIEDAVKAVEAVNEQLGKTVCTLDIYGQVDSTQTEWFENLKQQFTNCVQYCGCVKAEHSVEVLREYFALLFPTHFYTEGIPGTIIDAYASGIPVISARWESYSDVIEEGKTGIGYEFNNIEQLKKVLLGVVQNPDVMIQKKKKCLKKAKEFIPENAIKVLINRLYTNE